MILDFPATKAEREQIDKIKAELAAKQYTMILLEGVATGELMTIIRSTGLALRFPCEGSRDVAPVLHWINPKGAA
jgi:hypothetical protein